MGSPVEQRAPAALPRDGRSERALGAAAPFRVLAETTSDGVWIADLDGRLTFANAALAGMLGYEDETLAGMDVTALVHPQSITTADGGLRRARGRTERYELRFRRRDGSDLWGLVATSPLLDDDRRMLGTLSTVDDVTALKTAEDALEEANRVLDGEAATQRADLVDALRALTAANKEAEAFSYSVSHDLRAPLRSIDGFSSALLEDYGDQLPQGARAQLDRVRAASQRMGVLIDELLALSRISRRQLKVEPIDVSALAHEVGGRLAAETPERDLTLVVEPGLRAHADPTLLQLALENLLANAWKFTSRREDARVEVGAAEHEGRRCFYVRDNGAGFDMAFAGKLFRAFERLHRQDEFPGTGIGLSIVQRVMRRHGGAVWAEAQLGHGASFYFELPDGSEP